MAKEITNLQFF